VERTQEKEYVRSLDDDLGHDERNLPLRIMRISCGSQTENAYSCRLSLSAVSQLRLRRWIGQSVARKSGRSPGAMRRSLNRSSNSRRQRGRGALFRFLDRFPVPHPICLTPCEDPRFSVSAFLSRLGSATAIRRRSIVSQFQIEIGSLPALTRSYPRHYGSPPRTLLYLAAP
jgi:hypothetical protein